VVLAREAMTLDHLSGGRCEVGLGAGWDPRDYRRAGVTFGSAPERIERLAEGCRILRHCFTRGPFTFSGRHYQVDTDRPVGPAGPGGGPRIIIGGGGPKVLRLAGELADIVSLNPRMKTTNTAHTLFGDHPGADETDRQIRWVAEGAGDRLSRVELSTTVYTAAVTDDADRAARRLARFADVTPDLVRHTSHALIGTISQICDDVLRRRDRWGLSYLMIDSRLAQRLAPVVEKLAGC
jgi:probable F420-dependent oxidoreductase